MPMAGGSSQDNLGVQVSDIGLLGIRSALMRWIEAIAPEILLGGKERADISMEVEHKRHSNNNTTHTL